MDLPTGYSPPPYANTSDDRGGWAVIASSVGLVFILLLASIRSYTRNPFRSRILWEDAAIIIATVSSLIQAARFAIVAYRNAGLRHHSERPGHRRGIEGAWESRRHNRPQCLGFD